MATKSTYLETAVLNGTLRNTGIFAQSGTVYVALKTANPTDAGSGGTEPTIGTAGYARGTISRATGSWSAPTGTPSSTNNSVAISFPESTGAWASSAALTHFELRDAATGGNLLYYGALAASRVVDATGITVTVPIGGIVITEQ